MEYITNTLNQLLTADDVEDVVGIVARVGVAVGVIEIQFAVVVYVHRTASPLCRSVCVERDRWLEFCYRPQ